MKTQARSVVAVLAILAAGCEGALDPSGDRSDGFAASSTTDGPMVVWDIEAKPLPEIPLPNDAATRLDPTSATGRRLNVSTEAATHHEREVRETFNTLDGFGTLSPITVSFDAPLDIADLLARHRDNDDFRDDAVFVFNVDPSCRTFGDEVGLDIGGGRFPIDLYRRTTWTADPDAPDGYRTDERGNLVYPFDRRGHYMQLLFEEITEDVNRNGQLDPGEDLDHDGRLDVANFDDPFACMDLDPTTVAYEQCVVDHMLTFYERETNTLILRPVWPLEQRCTYAVVITERLRGEDGVPVQSPFIGVAPRDQLQALRPVRDWLSRYGLARNDIAFAWTFTTGSMTAELELARQGLYGVGPLAEFASAFPPSLDLWTSERLGGDDGSRTMLPGACAGGALAALWNYGIGEWDANLCAMEADFSAMAGLFGGTFEAPDLLVDRDGRATPMYPDTVDERWDVDPTTGNATWDRTEATFWCSLPIERNTACSPGNPEGTPFCRPFPVVLYAHGYGSARGEISSHMGRHNAMGFAACSIDSYGHGLNRAIEDDDAAQPFALASVFFSNWYVPELFELLVRGRDRDLNNDGLSDPGADMWTSDLFHTRDMVRQSALETMQFVRILRSADGTARNRDGSMLGDVDGDGVVDLGGPQNTISMWGISLGGIIAGVLAGAEPALDAVSPNAGGAGLVDISLRSNQSGVPAAVLLPMMGPTIVGCVPRDAHQTPLARGEVSDDDCLPRGPQDAGPFEAGTMRLAFYVNDTAAMVVHPFAEVTGVEVGDRILVRNLSNGESVERRVGPRGWFRAGISADALDPGERRALLGLQDGDTAPVRFDDTLTLGDAIEVVVYIGDSDEVRATVRTFERDVTVFGTTYPAGAPLVVLQEGLGYERNTPDFRRFVGLAQGAISPADPGVWAQHIFIDPIDGSYDGYSTPGHTRVLMMPTGGDQVVPVNTGIHNARAAGLFGRWERDPSLPAEHGWREIYLPDARYGRSIDQELVARYVVEGNTRLQRYANNPINPNVIYDIDNVSDGDAAWSCGPSDWSGPNENECPDELRGQEVFFGVPHPATGNELRLERAREGGGFDAFRVPLLRPAYQHGIYNAQPFREFDHDAFMVNFTARFLHTRGGRVDHLAGCDCSASRLPGFTLDGFVAAPALGRTCGEDQLNLCSPACADGWGIITPDEAACTAP